MKCSIILVLLISILPKLKAQSIEFPYWNKVDSIDLVSNVNIKDSSANAVYLMNYCRTEFEVYAEIPCFTDFYHVQIKILNKAAFELANVKLEESNFLKITNIEAQVYNYENGEKEVNQVTDYHTIESNDFYESINFTFPNIKVGSVIEYKYAVTRPFSLSPTIFYLQKKYPVKVSQYNFIFPSVNNYRYVKPDVNFIEEGDSAYFLTNLFFMFQATEHYWIAENIEPIYEEPFVHNIKEYQHKIEMQLTSFQDFNTSEEIKLLSNWDDLATLYRSNENSREAYQKAKKIKQIIKVFEKKVVLENTTQLDKVQLIYDFIQANIEWNEDYSTFTSMKFKQLLKVGVGSSADINLLFVAMLRYYGINANPTLISTLDNGKVFTNYPFIGQFNHVLVAMQIDDKQYYLDAINPDYPLFLLPKNSLAPIGLIIKDDTQAWSEFTNKKAKSIHKIDYEIDKNGILKGQLHQQFEDYKAIETRATIKEKTIAVYKAKTFYDVIADFELQNYKIDNLENVNDKPIVVTTDFEIRDAAQVSDNYLYINPFLGFQITENPFTSKERKLPIEFPFVQSEQILVNLKIPDEFVVESLPENVSYKLDTDKGRFMLLVKQDGNSIQILSKVNLYETTFIAEDYGFIKEFFDIIIQKQSNQIVLKRK